MDAVLFVVVFFGLILIFKTHLKIVSNINRAVRLKVLHGLR